MRMNDSKMLLAVIALTVGRLVVNMARRFPYPFLTEISSQLSVPVAATQNTLAVVNGTGAVSPLLAPLVERYGSRRVIVVSLWLMIISAVIGAVSPQFWIFVLVLLVWSLAKIIYDPAMQAYIGKHVPYAQRGRAIGITELSWAGSLLVIAPLTGYLLGASGVGAVLGALVLFAVVALVIIVLYLPSDKPDRTTLPRMITPLDTLRLVRHSPLALGALAYSLLLTMSNEIVAINYGIWLESSFNLVLAALGVVTLVISAAEVVGEFVVIGMADRFGKRRLALAGTVVAALGYLVLPFCIVSLPVALTCLFILFIGFEIAVVAAISLFTEILPEARAVMMGSSVAAHSIGRLLGGVIGAGLYGVGGGLLIVGAVAAVMGLIGGAILWRFVGEQSAQVVEGVLDERV